MSARSSKPNREREATTEPEHEGSELPEGWAMATVAELCYAIQSGSTPKADLFRYDEGIPFLKVYNIVSQAVAFEYRPQFVSEATHRKILKRAQVVPGDVLMNIVGPPLGKVAIVPDGYAEWNINQAIVLFRPGPYLDRRFLYFLLCSGIPYAEILAETRGSAGQSNISLSQCRGMQFPLPPLAEQHRIVAKLEELLGRVSRAKARLDRVPGLLRRFRQSVLAAACSGKLTADWREEHPDVNSDSLTKSLALLRENLWERRSSKISRTRSTYKPPFLPNDELGELPRSWSKVTVSQVAILDQGFAFKSSEFASHGIRLLRGENLEPGKFRWIDTRYWQGNRILNDCC
jgi:type I restriction enzyme, S subunit